MALVFVLMGMQLSLIVARPEGESVLQLVAAGALLSAVAIAVGFAWICPALYLPGV